MEVISSSINGDLIMLSTFDCCWGLAGHNELQSITILKRQSSYTLKVNSKGGVTGNSRLLACVLL
jgi:hypothetical protein